MLTTDDVSNLFFDFRSAYGNLWRLGENSIPVWRKRLARFTAQDLDAAFDRMLAQPAHAKHPPSLPEFVQILEDRGRPPTLPSTYQDDAPAMPINATNANICLLRVVMNQHGVSNQRIGQLVALKNAMLADFGETPLDPGADEWKEFEGELRETASAPDPNRKRDGELAREKFCRQRGIRYVAAAL